MATDKKMPPADLMEMPPADDAAPGDMAPPAKGGGGVMISMPRDAFEAIRSIVTELASGLDALSASIAKQAGEGMPPEGAGMPPEASAMPPGGSTPPGGMSGADDEFLKGIAMEGSQR